MRKRRRVFQIVLFLLLCAVLAACGGAQWGGDGYITGESAAKLAVKEYLKNSAVCSTLQHGGAQITVHPQDGGGSYEDASEDATVLVPGGGKKARVTDGPDGMP